MRLKITHTTILAGFLAVLVSLLHWVGGFTSSDNRIVELHQTMVARNVSGNIALIAIDKKSLDSFGVWPWPRSIYAKVIDNLVAAGVQDIFIDIDFSARSNDANDEILAQALQNAGGGVILPVFRQQQSAGSSQTGLTTPIKSLAKNSWLGQANVLNDPDGYVRRIPAGEPAANMDPVAYLLAGRQGSTKDLLVDFSISPSSVDTMSMVDVLAGTVGKHRLEGKSVVIGATAAELKDAFMVPVHGIMTGPMIHIIAAETLVQDRGFRLLDFRWFAIPVLAAAILITWLLGGVRLPSRLGAFFAMAVTIEIAAAYLQINAALLVPTAALQAFLGGCMLVNVFGEIDLKEALLSLARADRNNTRIVFERVFADSADALVILTADMTIIEASSNAGSILHSVAPLQVDGNLAGILPADLEAAIFNEIALRKVDRNGHKLSEVAFEVAGRQTVLEYSVTASELENAGRKPVDAVANMVFCIAARDITTQRAQQHRIEYLSRYDPLTGAALRQTVLEEIAACCGRPFAIFATNLKRFKNVNAVLGRRIGDLVLQQAADRLSDMSAAGRVVGRLGGDTFVYVVELSGQDYSADEIAEYCIRVLELPYEIDGKSVDVGARVGYSDYDADYNGTALEALERAELALDAGELVRGTHIFRFTSSIAEQQLRSEVLEHALRHALENDEIMVFYQPQVELATGQFVGAEALVRWQHPQLGLVSPAEFIPIAEANGIINQIGIFALKTACMEAVQWAPHIGISVNLSPLQLLRPDLYSQLDSNLAKSGLSPDRLTLEITESAFEGDFGQNLEVLTKLRSQGIRIGLDDFGTGYSSLSQLTRFPIDEIKIDQSFVRTLLTSPTNRAIIRTVESLARSIGAHTVCEGIETEDQHAMLNAMGCSVGQGYLFGKPMSQTDIRTLMTNQADFGYAKIA